MISVISFKIICIPLFFVIAIVCGLLPIFLRRFSLRAQEIFLGLGNSCAGGIFLAVGYVDLLSDCMDIFQSQLNQSQPWALILCPFGFLLVFMVERVCFNAHGHSHSLTGNDHEHNHEHKHEHGHKHKDKKKKKEIDPLFINTNTTDEETQPLSSPSPELIQKKEDPIIHEIDVPDKISLVAFLLLFILSFHELIDGFVLGLQIDYKSFLAIFIAIISHQWIESFALGVGLMRNKVKSTKIPFLIAFYSITAPLGLLVGILVEYFMRGNSTSLWVRAVATAIAAGTFFYVAIVDILLEEFSSNSPMKIPKFVMCLIGFGMLNALLLTF